MQTIYSIAKKLEAQGHLNKEALKNFRKWQWKKIRGAILLLILFYGSVYMLGGGSKSFFFVSALTALFIYYEIYAPANKKVRLYTYGEKAQGKYIKTTQGRMILYLHYQFDTKKDDIISARESFDSGKSIYTVRVPFAPNQSIEVLYNPNNLRESTVFLPEFNQIFNLKRES